MKTRGFTLLEVLIALAIVALSVSALLGTVTSSASNISYLKDKTLAEWVALNRLTEIRISKQMPDVGRRLCESTMSGMRWQTEEEVTELPIEGMFRIDVHARPTDEAVDDSREPDKPAAQQDPECESASDADDKLNWTSTVTGVVSSARSDRQHALAAPLHGQPGQAGPRGPNNPGGPNTPGAPAVPGGKPGNPGNPRNPGDGRVPPPASPEGR
ncbi:MAG TPA: type II secretion system minor pseudopilin GspI [Steroidobacteraceae bacterium]|nr:type II secretion system minor pseudopilin GspI [Steroidobacteraceae bacterium]